MVRQLCPRMTNLTLRNRSFIMKYFQALYAAHLIYPFGLMVVYSIIAFFRKEKLGGYLLNMVELFALGHALVFSIEMINHSTDTILAAKNTANMAQGGGYLAGVLLAVVTVIAIIKVIISDNNEVSALPKAMVYAATFGIDGNEKDVLPIIKSLMVDGKLDIIVSIDFLGDPVRNVPKRLKLVYGEPGNPITKEFPEGMVVKL